MKGNIQASSDMQLIVRDLKASAAPIDSVYGSFYRSVAVALSIHSQV